MGKGHLPPPTQRPPRGTALLQGEAGGTLALPLGHLAPSQRGGGLWPGYHGAPQSGRSLPSPARAKAATGCHPARGVFLPSDPILRGGLPECGVREPGPGAPGGQGPGPRAPACCPLGLPRLPTRFPFRMGRQGQRAPGLPGSQPHSGKGSQRGDAPRKGC